ncbi:barstar family protein [Kutzneria buriramensis]|uniref:Barstar (Barnase inhibitor) n=1 Tax=Kutzneria buriramensis TaxID=1045776 RepID=A0A3E0GVR1_9PSEU|nr:barstar family protein [Kutzneria buriramensis]REH30749.1 barstar (barnase inhibitor) [Kutzneria buriramensis]
MPEIDNGGTTVRWQLIDEDDVVWGQCADVEGLFVDPEPPLRERFTLVDCEPVGELAAALADGRPTMMDHIAGYTGDWPLRWLLNDVLVIGADPVVVEGVLDPEGDPDSPSGYRLDGRHGPLGTCRELAGLDRDRPEPALPPLRLLGCEPRNPLESIAPGDVGGMFLAPLGRNGWFFHLRIAEVEPSTLGDGLVDLTVGERAFWSDRPPRAAIPVWDMWFAGGPDTTNLWAPLDTATRTEWVAAACQMRQPGHDREPGRTYHLDGRYVTDEPGFHCALGEAINGPGGYFGRCWNGVRDCLGGNFGAQTPFTLIWHDSAVARRFLTLRDPKGFDEWAGLLRDNRVTVELA